MHKNCRSKMNKPKITVLMPVFKTPREYFENALNSILNQTFSDFELLLLYEPMEGDGLRKVMDSVFDKRVTVIYIDEHAGLPHSLNVGLNRAQGKYIARMDADDQSELDRFEKQYNYMEAHPNVAVLGGAVQIMNTSRLTFNHLPTWHQRQIGLLFQNYGVGHPTAMLRRSFLEEHKIVYNESIRGSEDYYLWTDVVKSGGVVDSIKDVVLQYRVYDDQASNRYSKQMIGWDALAKKNLWDAYGAFTEEEIEQASNIVQLSEKASVKTVYNAFWKLLDSRKLLDSMTREEIQDELAFWWAYGALLRVKHEHVIKWLFSRCFLRMVPMRCWKNVVERLIDVKKESE